jgi:hypothetical protein
MKVVGVFVRFSCAASVSLLHFWSSIRVSSACRFPSSRLLLLAFAFPSYSPKSRASSFFAISRLASTELPKAVLGYITDGVTGEAEL